MPQERKRRKKIEEQISESEKSGLPLPYISDEIFARTKTFVATDDFSNAWREETPSPCQPSSFRCFIRGEDFVHKG